MKTLKYHPQWPLQAAAYHHAGIPPAEMAAKFGLSSRDFERMRQRHPEFDRAITAGSLDDPVEQALLRRAIGFKQSETIDEDIVDKKSGEILESCRRRTVTKEIPPDIRALLFWLKNRRPDRWQERARDEDTGNDFEFNPDATEKEL